MDVQQFFVVAVFFLNISTQYLFSVRLNYS